MGRDKPCRYKIASKLANCATLLRLYFAFRRRLCLFDCFQQSALLLLLRHLWSQSPQLRHLVGGTLLEFRERLRQRETLLVPLKGVVKLLHRFFQNRLVVLKQLELPFGKGRTAPLPSSSASPPDLREQEACVPGLDEDIDAQVDLLQFSDEIDLFVSKVLALLYPRFNQAARDNKIKLTKAEAVFDSRLFSGSFLAQDYLPVAEHLIECLMSNTSTSRSRDLRVSVQGGSLAADRSRLLDCSYKRARESCLSCPV
jgi:hypothetical protein